MDVASGAAVSALEIMCGDDVLDLCAAPGESVDSVSPESESVKCSNCLGCNIPFCRCKTMYDGRVAGKVGYINSC